MIFPKYIKIHLLSTFLIYFIPNLVFPDTILLTDGNKLEGLIIKSNENDITIQSENFTTQSVNKDEIDSLIFSHADILYFLSGGNVQCKVIDDNYKYLTIVTSEGIEEIYSLDIKRYFYNQGNELAISFLPITGSAFFNGQNPKASFWNEKNFRRFFIGLNLGYIITEDKWQQVTNIENNWTGFLAGMHFGISTFRNLYLKFGFEELSYQIEHPTVFQTYIYSTFSFFSIEYTIESNKLINIILGIDYGLLNLVKKGRIVFTEKKETKGFRPRAGMFFYLNKNISLHFEYAYMIGKVKGKLTRYSIPGDVTTLNLNGNSFIAGIKFHFNY